MSKTLLAMLVEQLPRWQDGDGEFARWSPELNGGCVRFVGVTSDMDGEFPAFTAKTTGVWGFKRDERPADADSACVTRSQWLEARYASRSQRFGVSHDEQSDAWAEEQAKKYPAYWREIPAHWRFIDTYRINQLFPVDDASGAVLHSRKKLILAGVRTGGKSLEQDLREAVSTLECKLNG